MIRKHKSKQILLHTVKNKPVYLFLDQIIGYAEYTGDGEYNSYVYLSGYPYTGMVIMEKLDDLKELFEYEKYKVVI